jgi:hypothetical protein
VSWSEIVFGSALAGGILALAVFIGWRQVVLLRKLRGQSLPEDEMRWESRKAWRRLVSAGLLLVIAALLGSLVGFYEPEAQRLADERAAVGSDGPPMTEEQKTFVRLWGGLVIALLLVLLALVALAGVDLWATRLYGLRQFRKLQADRRAMIERQAMRLRQDRNGHG